MKHACIMLLAIGLFLTAQVVASLNCFGDEAKVAYNGKYKGRKPSDAELKEVLQQHVAWVKDGRSIWMTPNLQTIRGERISVVRT